MVTCTHARTHTTTHNHRMATTVTAQIAGRLLSSRLGQRYAKRKLGENMDILLSFRDILVVEGRGEEGCELVRCTLALCARLAVSKHRRHSSCSKEGASTRGERHATHTSQEAVWVFLEDLHTLCWARLRSQHAAAGSTTEGGALDDLRSLWQHTRGVLRESLGARLGERDVRVFEDLAAQLEGAVFLALTQPRHAEALGRIKAALNTLLTARLR